MGIKESNLPIAESLGSGDKLRIVTSDGASKQIGADSVIEKIEIGWAWIMPVREAGKPDFIMPALNSEHSLDELVGGKTVIGVTFACKDENDQPLPPTVAFNGAVLVNGSPNTNIVLAQPSELVDKGAMVSGLVVSLSPTTSSTPLGKLYAYAICI